MAESLIKLYTVAVVYLQYCNSTYNMTHIVWDQINFYNLSRIWSIGGVHFTFNGIFHVHTSMPRISHARTKNGVKGDVCILKVDRDFILHVICN